MTKATVLVPVLAAEHHVRGLVDLIAALVRYERDTSHIVAVCDGPMGDVKRVAHSAPIPVDVISHPRAGRGNGLFGGGASGTLAGLAHAATLGNRLVVKIDTDALIIDSCFAQLADLFAERPEAGVVGALRSGSVSVGHARAVRRVAGPVAIWRQPPPGQPRIVPLLWGPSRRAASLVKRARAGGWEPGAYCQGGAYAVSRDLVDVLSRSGVLDHPLDWLYLPLGEDLVISALAAAFGFELIDASNVGQPFGVEPKQLPAPAPEVRGRGHALIHSLKGDPDGRSELELREYFAALRRAD